MVQFVLARDPRGLFRFAALQSDLGRATVESQGDDPSNWPTFYVQADYRTAKARVLSKAAAFFFVLDALGWPWKAAGIFTILPMAWLNAVYGIFARNRYRLFGRTEQCYVPRPEYRDRFIDA
jgi:predicted DCC family thiol-disulfide oxidoreductase YuxK